MFIWIFITFPDPVVYIYSSSFTSRECFYNFVVTLAQCWRSCIYIVWSPPDINIIRSTFISNPLHFLHFWNIVLKNKLALASITHLVVMKSQILYRLYKFYRWCHRFLWLLDVFPKLESCYLTHVSYWSVGCSKPINISLR